MATQTENEYKLSQMVPAGPPNAYELLNMQDRVPYDIFNDIRYAKEADAKALGLDGVIQSYSESLNQLPGMSPDRPVSEFYNLYDPNTGGGGYWDYTNNPDGEWIPFNKNGMLSNRNINEKDLQMILEVDAAQQWRIDNPKLAEQYDAEMLAKQKIADEKADAEWVAENQELAKLEKEAALALAEEKAAAAEEFKTAFLQGIIDSTSKAKEDEARMIKLKEELQAEADIKAEADRKAKEVEAKIKEAEAKAKEAEEKAKEAEIKRKAEEAKAKEAENDDLISKDVAKDLDEDSGRRKPVKMENLRGEKPGFVMAEGTNWWSVDEKDPYWQTKEGYKEAMNLYGQKPSWVKEPSLEYNPRTGKYDPIEKEEFAEIKPKKRISI